MTFTPTKLAIESGVRVFQSGTVTVDLKNGRKLKVHDQYPGAPVSPFYISLRPDGVKDGKLQPADFDAIGAALAEKAMAEQLITNRAIVGIPQAGEPLVDALLEHLPEPDYMLPKRYRMIKEEQGGNREIVGFEGDPSADELSNLLAVDDLMANAGTKLEVNKQTCLAGGTMTDLLLWLNRSPNGIKILADEGVNTHVVWEFVPLMDLWLAEGFITQNEYDAILAYPAELEAYKAANVPVS